MTRPVPGLIPVFPCKVQPQLESSGEGSLPCRSVSHTSCSSDKDTSILSNTTRIENRVSNYNLGRSRICITEARPHNGNSRRPQASPAMSQSSPQKPVDQNSGRKGSNSTSDEPGTSCGIATRGYLPELSTAGRNAITALGMDFNKYAVPLPSAWLWSATQYTDRETQQASWAPFALLSPSRTSRLRTCGR